MLTDKRKVSGKENIKKAQAALQEKRESSLGEKQAFRI